MAHLNPESRTPDIVEGHPIPGSAGFPDSVSEDGLIRSRFLVSMGHTLRGPLNSILGFAGILLEGPAGPLTDRQKTFVHQIVGAGERQLEIIDNLISLACHHADEASFEPRSTRVHQLLERAVDRFKARAEASSVTILLDAEADLGTLFVDSEGVERAIGNLLSNAIRHLDPGGVVRVAAGMRGSDGKAAGPPADTVAICVADSGEGIDPKYRESLFDDLKEQSLFETRRQQRLGTGLPLARRLIEREGGSVSLQNTGERGDGNRFLILLPSWTRQSESNEPGESLAHAAVIPTEEEALCQAILPASTRDPSSW